MTYEDITLTIGVSDIRSRVATYRLLIETQLHPSRVVAIRTEVADLEKRAKAAGDKNELALVHELQRRIEFALIGAILRGQEEGWIAKIGYKPYPGKEPKESPKPYFSGGADSSELRALGKASAEEFEKALQAGKEIGDLSRAGILRRLNAAPPGSRSGRAALIRELAEQGLTSAQMAPRVGVKETIVRRIARDYAVDIPGDKAIHKQKKVSSVDRAERIVETVHKLDSFAAGLQHHDFTDVALDEDPAELVRSITRSITEIRSFANKIQETTR